MSLSISLIIPTRDRPDELSRTLRAIGALDLQGAPVDVIVVDNASRQVPTPPARLRNGAPVRLILRRENEAAASRNAAARASEADWLLMLDDDSAPTGAGFLDAASEAHMDVGAISAEITLSRGGREAGGLPEVFIGCGALIRRDLFLDLGGYDAAFHFYAEEYDLSARMIRAGFRITRDARFTVEHRKVTAGRNMDLILRRLVRNNAWVEQRYAPDALRAGAIEHLIERYQAIAAKEGATAGFEHGLRELRETIGAQPRTPLSEAEYDRFTGLAHAREHLATALAACDARAAAIVAPGKNVELVCRAVCEQCVSIAESERAADVLIVGTLSPGPMLDARDARATRNRSGRWLDPAGRPVLTAWDADAPAAAPALAGGRRI